MLKRFLSGLFPRRCAYCGRVVAADVRMCSSCVKEVPRIDGEICVRCGREKKKCTCTGAMYYTALAAPFYYSGVVRKGMHSFKFRNSPRNAEAFAFEMAKTVSERYGGIDFGFIAAVPMDKQGIKARGYNQVQLLANELSQKLGVEFKDGLLVKLYPTEKQHGLSRILRKGNLTGVFDINEPALVEGKNVLLCDDVSTSGETLNECAKMLWLYGAKNIYCITLAVTENKKERR